MVDGEDCNSHADMIRRSSRARDVLILRKGYAFSPFVLVISSLVLSFGPCRIAVDGAALVELANRSRVPATRVDDSASLKRNRSVISHDVRNDSSNSNLNRSLSLSEMFREARAEYSRPINFVDLLEWIIVFILIAPGSFPAFSCIILACVEFWRRRYTPYAALSTQSSASAQPSFIDDGSSALLWDPARTRRRFRSSNQPGAQLEEYDVSIGPVPAVNSTNGGAVTTSSLRVE